jgi:hypothetical protein
MSVRVAIAAAILSIAGASGVSASLEAENSAVEAVENHLVQVEERALSDLGDGSGAFVISPSEERVEIEFQLPPHAVATEAWLTLVARPAGPSANGLISVSLNGGEPVNLRPQAQSMRAGFSLFSRDVRAGRNILSIAYSAEAASAGWLIDARDSSLRLELDRAQTLSSLGELETALGADFAAPRRVALLAEDNSDRALLEGLTAQGLALRAGRVPNFTAHPDNADLVVRIATTGALGEAERAALSGAGPTIALLPGARPHIVITGRNADEAAAASRLFAARSLRGVGRTFLAADAMEAERLGRPVLTRDTRGLVGEDADLRTFATSALPFSAGQGSRTAVQIAAGTEADRMGALSVLARAALTSGEAWIYAWYGETEESAPIDHHLLIIGPRAVYADEVQRSSTPEWRTAWRQAERSQGRRGFMRFAAAAYADGSPAGPGLGVAGLFRDSRSPDRWIATLGAPAEASFADAGRSLARSELWGALEGRAAIWSDRGVTAYDYSVSGVPFWKGYVEFAVDNARIAALILFMLSAVILGRALMRRRRRVNGMSSEAA